MQTNRRMPDHEWSEVWSKILSMWPYSAKAMADNEEVASSYRRTCENYTVEACVSTLRWYLDNTDYRPKPKELRDSLRSEANAGMTEQVVDQQAIKDARQREYERCEATWRHKAKDTEMPDAEFQAHIDQARADDWRIRRAVPIMRARDKGGRQRIGLTVVSARLRNGLKYDEPCMWQIMGDDEGKPIPPEPARLGGNLNLKGMI